MSTEREDRTAHWGACESEECLTCIIIYPHPDAIADLPDTGDWDTSPFFMDCPVCGGDMFFGGTDHPADVVKNYR